MRNRLLVAVLMLVGISACSTLNINLPAVTDAPSSERLAGKIVWHDLLTNDIDGSRKFYGGLFGWTFEEVPITLGFGHSGNYLLIRHKGELIGGMVDTERLGTKVNNSQWVVLMSVDDVDTAAQNVVDAGGEIMTPPTDLNERGRIAVVRDNAGALFAILQTRDGDPVDTSAAFGSFMWDEVWVPDAAATAMFYERIAPFHPVSKETSQGAVYRGLGVDGRPRMGILQSPITDLPPTWASYIRVEDMSVLDRVVSLGGEILLPVEDREIGGQVALIAGPSGAGVVLQTWPSELE
jgi:predicted enzyme related to lactoylglutathione lyase